MPDYIYLLENRLSAHQRDAIRIVRDAARDASITLFLTGGAVRDLTTGSPVHDLDFTVQGNALNLKQALTLAGAKYWGEHTPSRTLFMEFPGSVRAEISSARREEYPKPNKPVYSWDTILEDLRRRDFTANAMALSLNDMSFGLLMDPLNGVADIESRTLRLVSNYGFIEAPVRMLRASRLLHRLQWTMDEKTQTRLQNAKDEGLMQQLSSYDKGYELEEIGHEENPLAALKALEAEGWMKELFPAWTASCADLSGLEQMHEILTRLQVQGIYPDASSAAMELLTAKMKPADLAALKKMFVRQGFVKQWERLEVEAKEFAARLTAKDASAPSATWKLFQQSNPAAVLWLGLTGKGVATQNKYKNFFSVWPESKSQIPTATMQEMRITPELPTYAELLENYFYALIDGKLKTDEEIRAFLEPYSPPAPPPPVTIRRGRAAKKSEGRKSAATKGAAVETGDAPADEKEGGSPTVDVDELQKPARLVGKKSVAGEAPTQGLPASAEPAQLAATAPVAVSVKTAAKAVTAKAAEKVAAKPTALVEPAPAPGKTASVPTKAEPAKAAPAKSASTKAAAGKTLPTKPGIPAGKIPAKGNSAVKPAAKAKPISGPKKASTPVSKSRSSAAKASKTSAKPPATISARKLVAKVPAKKVATKAPAKKSATKTVSRKVARPAPKKPVSRPVKKKR